VSTLLPESAESVPTVPALRARQRLLEQAVDAARDPAARAALRDDIVALFRQAEAAEREVQALKDAVKALAGRWRGEEAGAPRATTSARVDHLGASTFVEKGWSRLVVGEAAEAEAALRRALGLAPGHVHAETLLAWACLEQGRREEAAWRLHHVLLREPRAALARACVGYGCLLAGAYAEAIEHLSRVAREGGEPTASLYAHFWLGLVYAEREMFGDAQALFRRALALGPNFLQASYELGRAQWFAGEPVAARETWRSAAASNTFNPWARRCAAQVAAVERGETPPRSFRSATGP
jgi:tetratricopeptide (TPR) repeat protein